MTAATAPGVAGIAVYGRQTREHMIAEFRQQYAHQLAEATAALTLPDDAIVVETYTGVHAMRNREIVQ